MTSLQDKFPNTVTCIGGVSLFCILAIGIAWHLGENLLRWWAGSIDIEGKLVQRTQQMMPSMYVCPVRIDQTKSQRIPLKDRLQSEPRALSADMLDVIFSHYDGTSTDCSYRDEAMEAINISQVACTENPIFRFNLSITGSVAREYEVLNKMPCEQVGFGLALLPDCTCIMLHDYSTGYAVNAVFEGLNNSLYVNIHDSSTEYPLVGYKIGLFNIENSVNTDDEILLPIGEEHMIEIASIRENDNKGDSSPVIVRYGVQVRSLPTAGWGDSSRQRNTTFSLYFRTFLVTKTVQYDSTWSLVAFLALLYGTISTANTLSLFNTVFPEWIDGKRYFVTNKPNLEDKNEAFERVLARTEETSSDHD